MDFRLPWKKSGKAAVERNVEASRHHLPASFDIQSSEKPAHAGDTRFVFPARVLEAAEKKGRNMAMIPDNPHRFVFDPMMAGDAGETGHGNPWDIPVRDWQLLPKDVRQQAFLRKELWGQRSFGDYLRVRIASIKASQKREEDMGHFFPSEHSPMTAKEAEMRMKEMMSMRPTFDPPEAEKPKAIGETPPAVETKSGIKIGYTNDVTNDMCVVTLRLPYNFVAMTTMPQEEKALFEQLMRSRKISDQLLGLEALVRYEENRVADERVAKENE